MFGSLSQWFQDRTAARRARAEAVYQREIAAPVAHAVEKTVRQPARVFVLGGQSVDPLPEGQKMESLEVTHEGPKLSGRPVRDREVVVLGGVPRLVVILPKVVSVLALVVGITAHAEPASEGALEIFSQTPVTGGVLLEAMVSPGRLPDTLLVESGGVESPVVARPLPVDLTVAVDVSALCRTEAIDQRFQKLAAELSRSLDSRSRVSVVAYSAEARLLLADAVPPSGLLDVRVLCTGRVQSVSPESALQLILRDRAVDPSLRSMVWVLSAGNLALSPGAAQSIRQKGLTWRSYIYSPLVFQTLAPSLRALALALGPQFGFGSWPVDAAPAMPIRFTWNAPFQWASTTEGQARVLVIKGEGLAPKTLEVPVGPSAWIGIKRFLGGPLALISILLGVGAVLFALKLVYGPRACRSCRRPYRRINGFCLACHPSDEPVLVADGPSIERRVFRFRHPKIRVAQITVTKRTHEGRSVYVASDGGGEQVLGFYVPHVFGGTTVELYPGSVQWN